MLTPQEITLLQEELKTAQNPLFIHDDDADGLASFLLLYRIHKEGRGFIHKTAPRLDARMVRKVLEINPDKIFILDVPIVEQEFIDGVNRPLFWIDHHQPLERKNIHYFNPRIKDPLAYIPTTRMAYQISANPNDLWIAAIGCLADWHLPDFIEQAKEQYPHLLTKTTDLTTIVYQEPIGKMVKMFFFLLKGPTSEVHKSVKILTRIESPDEILKQETPPGKFLYRRFEQINQKYEILLKEAKKQIHRGKIVLFYYTDQQWSFTSNLANELATLHPTKVIIIARSKSGEMKCSLRAQFPILKSLEKALVGIQGTGGGHDNACGTVIKQEDWEQFLENFKRELDHA
ncbi:TPA: DHH family phosphoesterase [Candidatus Woesearchaeota archaeon]|nr:DHH family phosphoesterase [Candidatus Woesearchaeota archaeon]HIG93456.1 DHH family phosphoesterase [Candidatus Woesearchaeota archaeon]HIH12324.1 DHH family phosphoesterase [Candidatus Woesearchaeota archaeon]